MLLQNSLFGLHPVWPAVARSTLADANESRDWRIYFELAQRLITKARALYVDEDFGVELANTVYALDATTIDLCLSMFPWAPFCSTKAAVKIAHAARSAGIDVGRMTAS